MHGVGGGSPADGEPEHADLGQIQVTGQAAGQGVMVGIRVVSRVERGQLVEDEPGVCLANSGGSGVDLVTVRWQGFDRDVSVREFHFP